MTEQRQPRVDPSDWASRRKEAMNRARELRSRIKEAEGNQGRAESPSLASKSELQRQQRSRQLEATQKLLDSQTGGINGTGFGSGRPIVKKSSDDEARNLERPAGGSSSRGLNGSEAELTVSQKPGGPYPQYQKPLPSKWSLHSNLNRDFDGELTNVDLSKRESSLSKNMQTLSIAATEDVIHSSVREISVEVKGRGRGRGRARPSISGGESYIGEIHGSRQSAVNNESQFDSRSRSPFSTSTISSSSNRKNDKKEERDDSAIQAYLRARRVPEYKDGECEKLALLRQRLVARRRNRQIGLQCEGSKLRHGTSEFVEDSPIGDSLPGERNDPDDHSARFSTSDSTYQSSVKQNRMQTMETEPTNDTDAQSQNSKMEGDRDDEASVVDITLIQCDCCKRSFAPKIYEKHFDCDGTPKCAVASEKKRAVFDSAKARIANNDNLNKDEQMQALSVNKKVTKEVALKQNAKSSSKRSKKGSKWREESNQFREAMRANRLMTVPDKKGRK